MLYTNKEITERRLYDFPNPEVIQEYRKYAAGDHLDTLSPKQRALLKSRQRHPLVDNIVDLVLNTAVSALRLEGWGIASEAPTTVDDGEQVSDRGAEELQGWLDGLWIRNNVKRLQAQVTYAALRDRDSAVSMQWRNGQVRLAREPWWDGESGIYVAYDNNDEYEFAVKEWSHRKPDGNEVKRRTVYEFGRIHRWYAEGEGWKPYEEPGLPPEERWGTDARPLPIPIVHFPNGTRFTEGVYGESDIKDLLGLQDDINSVQRDISASAMMTAFQRLFYSGVTNPGMIKLEPGGASGDDNPQARVTVIPAGEPERLIGVHEHKRQSIAVGSRTPMHSITGEWPSGSAILQADMTRRDKAEQQSDVHGPLWTMVAHRATEIANVYGAAALDEKIPIVSNFMPSERVDDLTRLEVDQARATLWETLSRMPREAMIQTGLVDSTTADKIVAERESMYGVVADQGLDPQIEEGIDA